MAVITQLQIAGKNIRSVNNGGTIKSINDRGKIYHFAEENSVSASEAEIVCSDGVDEPIAAMTLSGNTYQAKYSGTQLLNIPDKTQEINGVSFSYSNGILTARGTAAQDATLITSYMDVTAGTYTMSMSDMPNRAVYRITMMATNGSPYFDLYTDKSTQTLSNDMRLAILCRVYAGKTVDFTVKLQLQAGSTATPYEPYVGGTPSPSPEYPQPIYNCGDNGISLEVRGALQDESLQSPQQVSIPQRVKLSDGTVLSLDMAWSRRIADEIVIENGTAKYIKRVEKLVLDETIPIKGPTGEPYPFVWMWVSYSDYTSKGFCSHGKYELFGENTPTSNLVGAHANIMRMKFGHEGSAGEFKAWLGEQYAAGTPVTIEYGLAHPVITDITDTELGQQLIALHTYDGETILTASSSPSVSAIGAAYWKQIRP